MEKLLETAEEVVGQLRTLPDTDAALVWFGDWLTRRDQVIERISTDNISSALESVADELDAEAAHHGHPGGAALSIAAVILKDAAADAQHGGLST